MTYEDETTGMEIAIVGMSGRFPGADSVEQLWEAIEHGREGITSFTDEQAAEAGVSEELRSRPGYVRVGGYLKGVEHFDHTLFGYAPRDAALLDPQQRIFLECSWAAMEDAGYAPRGTTAQVGVYAGVSQSSYLLRNLLPNPTVQATVDAHELLLATDKDTLATRVAYHLDLRGPALTVQTACSSSLVAVHLACQALLGGECDVVLAGGVAVHVPQHEGYLHRPGSILSGTGHCRPFDVSADGTVDGNGVAVVVLKRLEDALGDGDVIHAVIKGTALNNDGARRVGFTAPGGAGQIEVIRAAQQVAGVHPATIGYVEAHGTGTALGDPIEFAALREAFGDDGVPCALGSVKALIGHLDAAAGVTGLIKAALALRHRLLPPSPYFTAPNPELDLAGARFRLPTSAEPWAEADHPRRAAVSSFGMGGTNAHAVLEEAPVPFPREAEAPQDATPRVLVLSARTPTALAESKARLHAHLASRPDLSLDDVAHTLSVGRARLEHRYAVAVRDRAEALRALESDSGASAAVTGVDDSADRGVAFLLPGQGSQHAGMGGELYRTERTFAQWVDAGADVLSFDLRNLLYGESAADDALRRTEVTQPALFVVEYALAKLWADRGVHPSAMLGHSLGEYVAAALAGCLDFEEALRLVAFRAELMAGQEPGGMIAVQLSQEQAAEFLNDRIALAASNSPTLSALSGAESDLAEVERVLTGRGIQWSRLHTSHAFHSPLMAPAAEPLRAYLSGLTLRRPQIPFVSNVTGDWITAEQATDPAYWSAHLLSPVRFNQGVVRLLGDGRPVLLEVGPGQKLAALARQHRTPAGRPATVVTSLPHPKQRTGDEAHFAAARAALWVHGAGSAGPERGSGRRVPLPAYPFERHRHWIDAPVPAGGAVERYAGAERTTPLVAATAGAETGAEAAEPAPSAPSGSSVAETVLAVWRELLGYESVELDDNFFSLGGHSLLATQVAARITDRTGFELFGGLLFEAPTPRELIALVEQGLGTPAALPEADPAQVSGPALGTEAEDESLAALLAEVQGMSDDQLRAMLRSEA
ncbi:beta-ketoacyl synthase N-terminal-like domain-containing protein [Streptomyces sp. SP17BM10]|uniref:type I polyketide synthase n=1 Tax=Streptomyces sp. SP17BM10 TaxID=3002530 RepID=UPI002E76EC99|nr:beta-ketoacyl synthase N-terminal-like domain-containing protein [Streptomyces sp. SP17BM10]MEE1784661.1 beta-ketoacyl synthase N-terminal-like domain-containing protein [Streptomyces sp. SP17BM10]